MKVSKYIQKVRYGSNFNKPYYMFRLLINIIKRRFLGQFPLRGIDFAVDYPCNLNCKHCFNSTMLKGDRKMELDDYSRVIKKAIDLGAINFAFQGGEFLILKNFEDILSLVDSKRYSLSVTTNGYLLNEVMVKRLKDLGVNTLTISLDSGLAKEHDMFRGRQGSFARATSGVDLAVKAGIKVVINTCITPQSIRSEGFKKLLDYVWDKKLLINTIFAAPSGKWADNEKIILSENDIRYYYNQVMKHPFVVRDIDSGYAKRGCQGGSESLYITPFGDVLPCPFIHIRAGNIFYESLQSIHERSMRYFHYQEKCLIAENREFIDQYITITKTDDSLPLSETYLDKLTAWDL